MYPLVNGVQSAMTEVIPKRLFTRSVYVLQCSVTCGLGSRRRNVVCKEGEQVVELSRCAGTPPPSVQSCQRGACPVWITSEWTDCSVTCATGFR